MSKLQQHARMDTERDGIVDTCPACGEPAACGMTAGATTCWCFDLPHVMPMSSQTAEGRCYCSQCLQSLIDEHATPSRLRKSGLGCLRERGVMRGAGSASPHPAND